MMKEIRLAAGERLSERDLSREGAALPAEVVEAAEGIVADVRERGDAAVRELTERFDGSCPEDFRVPASELERAREAVDPAFVASLEKAASQIRDFHEHELLQGFSVERPDGTRLGVRITPIASAGIYVPGGRANYPSTVLMNAIPAKVAGVGRIVMCTPPQAGGRINPYTLVAAQVAGVDEVFSVGGAQAIAALAYGTESIPKVDKITGPGNAYVAAAKRAVSGVVGIDMIAGPSEVCVLADETADAVVVASDLMAQAEHDPLASCYLATTDEGLVERVRKAFALLVPQSPRAEITRASLENRGAIVVCERLEDAAEAVNVIAPEHLELFCEDPDAVLPLIRNAGAIFMGRWSSEPLGDYVAGPNHTLPTGGTARFSSPLGVYDFQKRSSLIYYSGESLVDDASDVQVLAQSEGLWSHALSVGMRLRLRDAGADGYEDIDGACRDVYRVAWPEPLAEPRPESDSEV
jgi:histidinol dehydrogenase